MRKLDGKTKMRTKVASIAMALVLAVGLCGIAFADDEQGEGDKPEFCQEFGTLHFYTTEVGSYDPVADQTTAHGISYVYVTTGEMREQGTTLTMTIDGYADIPANKFFYFDGAGYTICDSQSHGAVEGGSDMPTATGNLTVTKKVESDLAAAADEEFDITVTLGDKTISGTYGDMTFENGVATVKLKDGQSATATGLPTAVTYSVKETTPDCYTAEYKKTETQTITSGACGEYGTLHFYTTEVGSYDPVADQTTAHGISYVYVSPGKMREQGTTLTMTIDGYADIPANKFFYFDGRGYTICDPQEHDQESSSTTTETETITTTEATGTITVEGATVMVTNTYEPSDDPDDDPDVPTAVHYQVISGDGSSWVQGSNSALPIAFDRDGGGAQVENLVGVEIDGKAVPEKDASNKANWTAKTGSIIIELQPSYLGTLSEGTHTLTASFDDGDPASAKFIVEAKAESNAVPATGDPLASLPIVLTAAAAIAVAIIAFATLKLRKDGES